MVRRLFRRGAGELAHAAARLLRPMPPGVGRRATISTPKRWAWRAFAKPSSRCPKIRSKQSKLSSTRLGIPARAVEDYLHRTLFDIGGWAAYARYLVWNSELNGETNDTLMELLAIRVAYGYGLFQARTDDAFRSAWAKAMADGGARRRSTIASTTIPISRSISSCTKPMRSPFQKKLVRAPVVPCRRIAARRAATPRPALQAAFCIDVRSEIFRRALETVWPQARDVGFAGFFGFPIEYVPIGHKRGGAQCPVLLRPAFTVCEAVEDARRAEETRDPRPAPAAPPRREGLEGLQALGRLLLRLCRDGGSGLCAARSSPTASASPARCPTPISTGSTRDVIGRVGPRLEAAPCRREA